MTNQQKQNLFYDLKILKIGEPLYYGRDYALSTIRKYAKIVGIKIAKTRGITRITRIK